MEVPSRVKSFLWRMAHNCLPTRDQLATRGIHCDDTCVVCEQLMETQMHTFFACSKAVKCWEKINMDGLVRELLLVANNFTTMFFTLFDRLAINQQAIVAMTLWSLWKCRNMKLWEGIDTSPHMIITRAKDALYEWSTIQTAKHPVHKGTNHDISWTKPPLNTVKCNVDCAFFNNNTIMGYGLCFRDATGQFMHGESSWKQCFMTTAEAEATALLASIKASFAQGYQKVFFETDCKLVVDALYSHSAPQNELGDIISLCKNLLSTNNNYVVSFVRRQANKV
ncbi:hypothetical protein TSUD_423510, partial [Trifolium subterraneum]